ncbi:immunoglobulin domain-containing protein [Piscinibacterium candidicorallinum]|uniref:Immunoglobulin domain-containing protein n=1 Tax=Piscinibacterium candidicorallinum TaxID=1793872 RepID=A0ABV7H002_9BURK
MNIRRTVARGLLIASAAAALAACGGGGGGSTPPPPPPVSPPPASPGVAVGVIGPAGGSLATREGAALVVPPEALVGDFGFSILKDATEAPPVASHLRQIGNTYAIVPHDLSFGNTAEVRLPFDPALLTAGRRPVVGKASPGGAWELIDDSRVEGNVVIAPVRSLSMFAPFEAPAPRFFVNQSTQAFFQLTPSNYAASSATEEGGLRIFGQAPRTVTVYSQTDLTQRATLVLNARYPAGSSLHQTCGSVDNVYPTYTWSVAMFYRDAANPSVVRAYAGPRRPDRALVELQNSTDDVVRTTDGDVSRQLFFDPSTNTRPPWTAGMTITPAMAATEGFTRITQNVELVATGTALYMTINCNGASVPVGDPVYIAQPLANQRPAIRQLPVNAVAVEGQALANAFSVVTYPVDGAALTVRWQMQRSGASGLWEDKLPAMSPASTVSALGISVSTGNFGGPIQGLTRHSISFTGPSLADNGRIFRARVCRTAADDAATCTYTPPVILTVRPAAVALLEPSISGFRFVPVGVLPVVEAQSGAMSGFSATVRGVPTPNFLRLETSTGGAAPWVDATQVFPGLTLQTAPGTIVNCVPAQPTVCSTAQDTNSIRVTVGLARTLGTGDVGRLFRLSATSTAGAANSTVFQFGQSTRPVIITQPVSQTVTAGSAVTFVAAAEGTQPLTYQWYFNDQPLAGQNTPVLTLSSVTSANAGRYGLEVTNLPGQVYSQEAVLTVTSTPQPVVPPPVIVRAPSAITTTVGSSASFSVVARGGGSLSYQWRRNGTAIAGATEELLSIGTVASTDAGEYTVVVTNSAGSLESAAARLTVNPAPQPAVAVAPILTSQPVGVAVQAGQAVSLSVAATGSAPLSYLWQRDGVNIPGATGPVLRLSNVQASAGGTYTVTVFNAAGTVNSNGAGVVVITPAGQPVISADPASATVATGSAAAFNAAVTGNPAPTCQWTRNGVPISGATSCTRYVTPPTTTADNGAVFGLTATNSAGSSSSTGATLTVTGSGPSGVQAPVLIQDPTSVTVVRGSQVAFTAVARGTEPFTYQWFFNGQPMPGRDFQVLGIGSVTDADAGLYSVRISNSAGSTTTNPARLTVVAPNVPVAPTISTQPSTLTAFTGQTVNLAVAANGSGPLTFQWRRNGVNVPSDGPVLTLANVQAANAGTYSVVVSNSVGSVTSNEATLSVNTPPTVPSPPTPPSIVTQPVNTTVTEGNTATLAVGVNGTTPMSFQWSRGGVPISGATAAAFTVTSAAAANAGNYSVTISNSAGSVTSNTVSLTVNAPTNPPAAVAPSISTQPLGLTAAAGQTVTFGVSANGTGPLSYQWQRNGNAIANSNSPVLSLSNVQTANAGDYTVTVSNSAGSVTSSPASLVVTPAPTLPVITASPQNRSVPLGSTATFTATVTGSPTPQCQWTRNGVGILGATNCASYTTPATTSADNGAVYNLVAYNTAGAVFGTGAVLTVQVAAPQIQSESGNQTVNAGSTATFSVSATGTELRYQWFRNGLALLNATGSSYTLQNAQLADNGASFSVQVCNSTAAGGQCVTSSAMTLTVNGGVNVGPPASVGACFGGQFGWCYVQPAPMANRLTGLAFEANGSGITVVGEAGTVLTSSDFGGTVTASWQTQRYTFTALASPSPGRLVAAIDDQDDPNARGMYLSTDGGSTWTRTSPSNFTVGIAFKDALVGVAVGPEQILRTTDGGSTWTALNVPEIVAPNSTNLTGVAYAGSDVFVASGIGRGVRSTDGGLSWSVVSGMLTANPNLSSVVFNGQGVGLALNDSQPVAARSTDFGASWSTVTLPFVAPRAAYGGANTVVIFGGDSRHSRSTDGGLNWSPETFSLPAGQQNWRPFMRNAQQGVAIGDYGAIARTVDGGETWSAIAGGNLNNTVWAIEANPSRSVLLAQINNGLKRSTDGRTWNDNATGVLATTFRQTISWGSDTVAAAATSFEGVFISADSGDTWTEIRPPTATGNYPAVAMADEQTLIVTSYTVVNGVIQSFVDRSTNGGQTWTRINLPGLDNSGVQLTAARFVSPTLGFVAGSAGTPGTARLWRTSDAGATWLQFALPDAGTSNRRDNIQAIQPGPNGTIFMATDSALLRSADTGFNWSRVIDSTDLGSMTDVRFSGSTGIAVGVGGIWRTDNGATWSRLDLPLSGAMLATAWAPGGLVLAGGDGGMLLANQSLGNLAVRPDNPSFKQTLRLNPQNATRPPKSTPRRSDISSLRKPNAGTSRPQIDATGRTLLQPPPLKQRIGKQWVSVPRGAPARLERDAGTTPRR